MANKTRHDRLTDCEGKEKLCSCFLSKQSPTGGFILHWAPLLLYQVGKLRQNSGLNALPRFITDRGNH